MTDHDITLQIMYDMGFPTDAIEVVKDDIYRRYQRSLVDMVACGTCHLSLQNAARAHEQAHC
jgi:hypothetical protein